ncbi:hypothetical protein THAOC_07906, partial [Thalassiosira oceanica]
MSPVPSPDPPPNQNDTTTPMTIVLEDTAGFPHAHATIDDYARACSEAVDSALREWPIAETTAHAIVSTGFVGTNVLRSTLWTQSFDVATPKEEES